MHTTDLVHRTPVDWPSRPAPRRPSLAPRYHELVSPVRNAILRARRALESAQRPDGSWLAATCGNSSLASELVLLHAFLEREDSECAESAANAVRADQRADGAWSRLPNGAANASASVLAYFALKLVGDDPAAPHMAAARTAIRALGGADASDESTRNWLALFGQIDYDRCKPIAPEWLLLPDAWQRRVLGTSASATELRIHTAMSVIWALRPVLQIAVERGIRELFIERPQRWSDRRPRGSSWSRPWAKLARRCEESGLVPFRRKSLALAEHLVVRQSREAAACEIGFAEVVWQIVALHVLGYNADDAERIACDDRLRKLLVVDESDAARPMASADALADSVDALRSLTAGGVATTQPIAANGAAWLADRLATQTALQNIGDCTQIAAVLETFTALTSGASDEHALPPDLQMARDRMARFLARQRSRELPVDAMGRLQATVGSTLAAQLTDTCNAEEVGTALAALASRDSSNDAQTIASAVARLRALQQANGSWAGDDNNGIASTAAAIRGLIAAGTSADDPAVAAGVNWLVIHRDEFGGWESTSRTARVILALVAAGGADHDATRRGIDALLREDEARAASDDEPFDLRATTATLHALSHWAVAAANDDAERAPSQFRLVGELSRVN